MQIMQLMWLFEEAARGKHSGFEKSNYLRSCIIGSQPINERENIKKITHSIQPLFPQISSTSPLLGMLFPQTVIPEAF